MNKEDYVSLEVAKLLKEKGYPQEYNVGTICRLQNKANPYYKKTREITQSDIDNAWCVFNEIYPTLYEAQKWLRVKKCIVVEPTYCYGDYFMYEIITIPKHDIIGLNERIPTKFSNYVQCLNAGILEALKLI